MFESFSPLKICFVVEPFEQTEQVDILRKFRGANQGGDLEIVLRREGQTQLVVSDRGLV